MVKIGLPIELLSFDWICRLKEDISRLAADIEFCHVPGPAQGRLTESMIDMLLAKNRAPDRKAWLMEKGDRAEIA